MPNAGLRLHHIGIITPDAAASAAFYATLGYRQTLAVTDDIQQIEIVLMQRGTEPLIELIRPLSETVPAGTWLKRIKAGAYHTCFETDDLQASIAALRRSGVARVYGPVPAIAFENRRVAFLWGRVTGLIELLEA